MLHQTESVTFPLSALHLSALNVRQVTDPERVSDLVASIGESGHLIENLCVTMETVGRKKKATPGVVVGGRRLLALQILAKSGRIDADSAIPCKVVSRTEAVELSLAENIHREDMTPIEEYRAFKRLADEDMPIEDIAARFKVTPLVVQRRLRLASVSPKLLAIAEADNMTQAQLIALAVTDDHAAQETAWFTAEQPYQRHPDNLRARLIGVKPKADHDPRMKLIGADAYRAAGGTFTTDLFADHAGYIDNPDLLDELVRAKLDEAVAAAESNGWTPVIVPGANYDHDASQGYFRMQRPRREATDAEREQIAKVQGRIDDLNVITEGYEAAEEELSPEDEARYEAAMTERDELDGQLEDLTNLYEDFTDAMKAEGVALVYLTHDGEISTRPGFTKQRAFAQERGSTGTAEKVTTFHSDRLASALAAARTMAMQAELVANPQAAYLAALDCMVDRLFVSGYSSHVIKITSRDLVRETVDLMVDADNASAVDVVRAAVNRWKEKFEQFAKENEDAPTLHWLLTLSEPQRAELMAVCVAVNADYRRARDYQAEADALTTLVRLDMRNWWTPTAANYFVHLSKPQILKVLGENGHTSGDLAKLKKAELAAKAEELMHGAGWLPGPLAN